MLLSAYRYVCASVAALPVSMSVPLWRHFLCNLQPFWHLLSFVAIIIIIVKALARNYYAVAYNVKQQNVTVKTASAQHSPPTLPCFTINLLLDVDSYVVCCSCISSDGVDYGYAAR